jgi:hypothetical protein
VAEYPTDEALEEIEREQEREQEHATVANSRPSSEWTQLELFVELLRAGVEPHEAAAIVRSEVRA